MSRAAKKPQSQSPVMIEEEPPHEFYANLLGKKAVKSATCSSASQHDREDARIILPVHGSSSSSSNPTVAIIPNDEKPPSKQSGETPFSRVYKRALSNPPKLSSLTLGESNRGYQLLEKLGWNECGGGLGRQRQGSMLPVKTVLKQDKKGLGCGTPKKARITHHAKKPRSEMNTDDSSTSKTNITETKAQKRLRRKQEAEKESRRAKRIRMILRSDVSDEYEKLYMKLHPG